MFAFFKGIIAILVALLLVGLVAASASAATWTSVLTSGQTSIESIYSNGTYTWTLRNMSSLPGDRYPDYDLLVWELTPFQVREPLTYSTPDGWEWVGDRWKITADQGRRYYTPGALGPGQAVTFSYTPDPAGELLNSAGPQPDALAFITHVAAVVPGSGSFDGNGKWMPIGTENGGTWYDRTDVNVHANPEPSGLLGLGVGLASICVASRRRVCMRAQRRSPTRLC